MLEEPVSHSMTSGMPAANQRPPASVALRIRSTGLSQGFEGAGVSVRNGYIIVARHRLTCGCTGNQATTTYHQRQPFRSSVLGAFHFLAGPIDGERMLLGLSVPHDHRESCEVSAMGYRHGAEEIAGLKYEYSPEVNLNSDEL
jgi:hypothetical protein